MNRVRRRLRTIGMLVMLAGCATQPPNVAPGTGTVTVGVVTTGPDVTALAFRVVVDGNPVPRTISADAGVLSTSLPAGEHVVTLGDLPSRCRIDGVPDRKVIVPEGRVAPVRFAVVCRE